MKQILFLTAILFGSFVIKGQLKTSTSSVEFAVENASMWEPSSAFDLNRRIPLFPPLVWDEGFDTGDGGITEILGAKFGAGMEANTTGTIGMDFYIEGFSLGEVDVTYPITVELSVPDDSTFSPGSEITISSSYVIDDGWELTTRYPALGAVGLDFIFGFSMDAEVEICVVECAEIPVLPPGLIDIPVDTLQIIRVSGIPGDASFYPCETGFCTTEPPRPLEFDAGKVPISGFVDLPFVETTSAIDGQDLIANGDHRYFELDLDIIELLALPPSSPFRALKGEIPLGPAVIDATGTERQASFEYALFTTNFIFSVTDNQDFKFEPKVFSKIGFPVEVEYQEKTPSGTNVGNPGKSDTIVFQVGNDLVIRFPCDYDFVDISTEYSMTNKFSNRTYDTFGGELAMSALSFGIDIPKFVVVPEFCIPEVCVFGACTPEICTPEVASPEFNYAFPPVWSESVPIFSLDVDYFNRSWEIPGFNNDIPGNPFRLTPKRFETDLLASRVSCFGDSTGMVEVNVESGTRPFSYRWSDGEHSTDSTLINVPAGNYYVKVTDANKCTALGSTELVENTKMEVYPTITDLLCANDTDGSIGLAVYGGVAPYSFNWSNGSTNQNAMNLSAGTISIEMTDDSNCVYRDTFEIIEPKELTTLLSKKENPSCFGDNDGSIFYESYGGVEPFTYSWSSGDVLPKATSLSSGNYTLTVTDKNGCTTTGTEELIDPPLLEGVIDVANEVSCFNGSDGVLSLNLVGGTEPYTIEWFKSENKLSNIGTDIFNLSSGQYLAVVTDDEDCIIQPIQVIPQPDSPLSINLSKTDVECFGERTGVIETVVSGGTEPYAYNWSSGSTNQNPTDLSAGRHQVTVTDDNGCEIVDGVILFQNDPIDISFIATPATCLEYTDGKVSITIDGGFAPYDISWDNGETTTFLENLDEGSYTLTVVDSNNCQEVSSVFVDKKDQPCFFIPSAFSPNDDFVNDQWIIRGSEFYENIEVVVLNKWKSVIFESKGYDGDWDGTRNGIELPAGTYYYTIDLKDGQDVFTGPVTIIRDK